MGLATSAKVFAAGVAWRLSGLAPAGRSLVRVASTGAEAESTLAKMLLVKAGDRSVPLVATAVRAGTGAVDLLDVLASIGSERARASLETLAAEAPGEAAALAAEALRQLNAIRDRRR